MEQSWKFQVVHGPQVCLLSNMLTWNKNIMCLMCFFFHASYKIQHILIWICAKILCSFPFYRKLCMICFFRWSIHRKLRGGSNQKSKSSSNADLAISHLPINHLPIVEIPWTIDLIAPYTFRYINFYLLTFA